MLMHHGTYDGPSGHLPVQMVFMDTALSIVTSTRPSAEYRLHHLVVRPWPAPILCELGVAADGWRRWGPTSASAGYSDFAGSGVYSVGAVTALALGIIVGRASASSPATETKRDSGHDITGADRLFHSGLRRFGFNPGSTLAVSGNGERRAARWRSTPCSREDRPFGACSCGSDTEAVRR